MSARRRFPLVLLALACACASFASAAEARILYATDPDGDAVNGFNLSTGLGKGGPIGTGLGSSPFSLAITPDGKQIVTANYLNETVSVIDLATRLARPPIKVGGDPVGVAISPDGRRAYVPNNADGTLSVIDLAADRTVGPPIEVGGEPYAVAVSPDGTRVYVSNHISESVSVIDTATGAAAGPEIKVGGGPTGLAITPDGKQLYVADGFGFVYVVDTATGLVYEPIEVGLGTQPVSVAISPNGARAYVSNSQTGTISVIDTATRTVLSEPIPVGKGVSELAMLPDGSRLMAQRYGTMDAVFSVDTGSNQVVGTPLVGGLSLAGIAIEPDQPPVASFTVPARVRPGVPVALVSTTTDSDSAIASLAWTLGDGAVAAGASVTHTYAQPGSYAVKLAATDSEGCSTAFVFTGQTALCNGGPGATSTETLSVAYPGVSLRCPKRAKGTCKFQVKAVQRKKKGKLKALSAVARAKAKPGTSVVISLNPKPPFAARLAAADQVLAQVTTTRAGSSRAVKVKKLKIVQ